MSRTGRIAGSDGASGRAARFVLEAGDMRNLLAGVTLLAFGCGQLRYASRTEMVEVAPDPATAEAPLAVTPVSSVPPRRSSHWQAFLIGGTVASLVGVGFIVGGAVGWKRQEAANEEANAQCMAAQGWFCGAFDGFSYLPYGALVGLGSVATLSGIVLFGIAANRHEREPGAR
jgi:hypothetical protein